MTDSILYVDDEPNVLAACKRSLGKKLNITTATSGQAGLEIIHKNGPFAVVLSDMRMPKMDGIEFLCAVRRRAPNTVCMMLTGNSDQETAMNAVNKGHIFRFLTKPCSREVLAAALEAGIRQHRLIIAEKELLQKTLTGAIRALTEVLELVNPKAFTRSNRIKPVVKALTAELKLDHAWQYEIAAMLSQIGCIVLPPGTVDKVYSSRKLTDKEAEMYASHPRNGRKLIEHIPRLGPCAQMIEHQLDRYEVFGESEPNQAKGVVALGAQMLHVAIDFDAYLMRGLGREVALAKMMDRSGEYNLQLLKMLERVSIPGIDEAHKGLVKELSVWKLAVGMFAQEDILTSTGTLLVPKGNEITRPLIVRLKNFASGVGLKEPIVVYISHTAMSDAA